MSRSREPSYYEVALTNRQVLVAFGVLLACVVGSFLAGVWVGRSADPERLEVASGPTEPARPTVPSLDLFAEEQPAPVAPSAALDPSPRPGTTLAQDLGAVDSAAGAAPPEDGAGGSETGEPAGEEGTGLEAGGQAASAPAAPGNGSHPPGWRQRQRVAREAERLAQEFERETGAESETPEAAAPGRPPAAPGTAGGLEASGAPTRPASGGPAPATEGAASPVRTAPAPSTSGAPAPAPRAPAVAPAPEPAGPRAAGVPFVVQVLSTADHGKARQTLSSLQDGGYPATLSTLERGSTLMYRVRLGPYRDRPAAERVAEQVRLKYRVETWITTE